MDYKRSFPRTEIIIISRAVSVENYKLSKSYNDITGFNIVNRITNYIRIAIMIARQYFVFQERSSSAVNQESTVLTVGNTIAVLLTTNQYTKINQLTIVFCDFLLSGLTYDKVEKKTLTTLIWNCTIYVLEPKWH